MQAKIVKRTGTALALLPMRIPNSDSLDKCYASVRRSDVEQCGFVDLITQIEFGKSLTYGDNSKYKSKVSVEVTINHASVLLGPLC